VYRTISAELPLVAIFSEELSCLAEVKIYEIEDRFVKLKSGRNLRKVPLYVVW